MDGCCEVGARDDDVFVISGTSPKKHKHRNKVKENTGNKKTVLFFAGFQMGEISQGVHFDVNEDNASECHESDDKCTSEEPLDHNVDDDDVDFYEDFEFSNGKKCSRVSSSTPGNAKPKAHSHNGLMKIAKENKSSRRAWNVAENCGAQKDNVGKRLEKQGIKKFGFDIYQKRAEPSKKPDKTKKHYNRYSSNNSRRHKENVDHPAALKYELKSSNIPGDAESHLSKLIDLQHRDLTPEDYELLLRLDDSVAPKTVSKDLLQSLVVITAEAAETIGELCSICMELYTASQTVKTLPCEHVFHEDCIDMWLSNSSLNCPLDGLAVEVT